MSDHKTDASFAQLARHEKAHFLVALAHGLTIVARDTYAPRQEGVTNPCRLRALNEVQHRVLAGCLALLDDNPQRYPDDVLLRIILEHPDDAELEQQIRYTF